MQIAFDSAFADMEDAGSLGLTHTALDGPDDALT
jgi:hypothetical protein